MGYRLTVSGTSPPTTARVIATPDWDAGADPFVRRNIQRSGPKISRGHARVAALFHDLIACRPGQTRGGPRCARSANAAQMSRGWADQTDVIPRTFPVRRAERGKKRDQRQIRRMAQGDRLAVKVNHK